MRKVLLAMPAAMLEQVDSIARNEHRTRSDLVREALRRYLDNFKQAQHSNVFAITILEPASNLGSISQNDSLLEEHLISGVENTFKNSI